MKKLAVLSFILVGWIPLAAQTTTPLNPGFGGVNAEVSDPPEYYDS
jgi:hypothetical protein